MRTSRNEMGDTAGQTAWTRALARDLFPDAVTPFHWTLLRRPAQAAMQRTWTALGASAPAEDFWRRDPSGLVYLNAGLVAKASREVHGAVWLGAPPEVERSGLFGRLQAQGTVKRVHVQVDAAVRGVEGLNERLAGWLAWVYRLRWTQADLLQVMEELEPQAQSALTAYFTLRAGLSAAQVEVAARLPDCPVDVALHLYAGLEGLPSVAMAYASAALRSAPDQVGAEQDFLARYGHRGPGEARPDVLRWGDRMAVLRQLAALPRAREGDTAHALCQVATRRVLERLDSGRQRQFEPLLSRARALCRAVDLAWDGLARVTAAAQAWLRAVATEALSAGLIADRAEVSYLEFEELKQVATGEWHQGRSEQVRADVARRRSERAACPIEQPQPPCAASPGHARGPVLRLDGPGSDLPPNAVMLVDVADPGYAPFWLSAAALIDGAGDPWTPGMIVARALGLPAVSGMPAAIARVSPGQLLALDAGAARIDIVP